MSDLQLAISLGDPAGIGPEVVLKAVARAHELRVSCTVVGDRTLLKEAAARLDLPLPERIESPPQVACPLEVLFSGRPSAAGGRAAAAAVRIAAGRVEAGLESALVTAPLNKEALALAGESHPGHTELLAEQFQAEGVRMMLQGGGLRVVLVTTHLALAEVPGRVTLSAVVETCRVAHEWLQARGISRPRLALAALNPHAGDGGRFGCEEEEVLLPALAKVGRLGILASGPHPADSLFARLAGATDTVDAVIALYHDQGLIPVKLMGRGRATNVTLGLPIVRTSPDHGTAYDIAGRGLAEGHSMLEALRVAAELIALP